jgi:hypothetical protein
MSRLSIEKLEKVDVLVIRQKEGREFFISSPDGIIISIPSLFFVLRLLISQKFITKQALQELVNDTKVE